MSIDADKNMTAAILTLSETMSALHEVLRLDLSFRAELQQNKLLETFVPDPLAGTQERLNKWIDLLDLMK